MANLYKKQLKRIFDLTFAFLAIIILSPIMIGVAILVKFFLGSPVIFKQQRPGLHGKLFTIYKFRTMKDIFDSSGALLSDEKRLTMLGRILRRFSLDELPELFNVLKGDMSLVGPRPLLVEYLELYDATQIRRHEVKSGITGWAQVCGRNALNWGAKFECDIWYIENYSFFLDIKILVLTVFKVLSCHGINHSGQVTMNKFNGNWQRRQSDIL